MWLVVAAARCRCRVRVLHCAAVLAAWYRWHRRTAREVVRAVVCPCRRALRPVAAVARCLCRAALRLVARADPCLYPLALGQLELAVMSCSLAARHPLVRAALCRWLAAAEAPVAAMCRFWEALAALRRAALSHCRVVSLKCRPLTLLPLEM